MNIRTHHETPRPVPLKGFNFTLSLYSIVNVAKINILNYFMTSHNCYMLCNTQNSTPSKKKLEYYCQFNNNALKFLISCKRKIYP